MNAKTAGALAGVLLLGIAIGGTDVDETSARGTPTTTRTLPPSPTETPGSSAAWQLTTAPRTTQADAPTTNPNVEAIEANRVAMESQQAAADAQATRLDRQTYSAIGEREYGVLARNPDAEKGRRIVVYGYVTQFDSATGNAMFRANTSAIKSERWYDFDQNTIVTFDPASGGDVIERDIVTLYAEIAGNRSYTTTLGASETALALKANIIDVGS